MDSVVKYRRQLLEQSGHIYDETPISETSKR
jgi:hypothetical protein